MGGERRLPSGTALLLAVVLAGCADGYPTEDRDLTSPHDMDNAARIAAMNRLGREADRSRPHAYRLLPGCRLEVSRPPDARFTVALAGPGDAAVRFERDRSVYAVSLGAQGTAVVETRRFHGASQFLLLLRLVARDCDA